VEFPDIHNRLLELGFTHTVIMHGQYRFIYYRLPEKSWCLVWQYSGGNVWKARYITNQPDTYWYHTAANAIDKSDRQREPVAEWRLKLAAKIRVFEEPTEQGYLL